MEVSTPKMEGKRFASDFGVDTSTSTSTYILFIAKVKVFAAGRQDKN